MIPLYFPYAPEAVLIFTFVIAPLYIGYRILKKLVDYVEP